VFPSGQHFQPSLIFGVRQLPTRMEHFKGRLIALLSEITPARKKTCLGTNTLAYFSTPSVMKKKRFLKFFLLIGDEEKWFTKKNKLECLPLAVLRLV
jgi:hypothetical protein